MPSARYAHPEFGYLWPVPGVRRALRVAMRSIVLGALIGAAGFIARSAGGDRTGYSALETWTATSAAEIVRSFAVEPMRRARQSGTAKPEDDRTGATKVACGDNSLGTLEETCVVPKPRQVRVPVATNSPTIARVPIGRTAALASGLEAAARSPANRPEPSPAALGETRPEEVVAATSEPTSAAPKKLQTTARREAGRHRVSDDGAAGYYDYARAAQFARGKAYARDNWYLHEASWRWSW